MINDYFLSLNIGSDIPIEECGLIVHQPTLEEIAFLGEHKFFSCISLITLTKEKLTQDKTLLSQFSNFQIFMKILGEKENADQKADIISFLMLLFPKYKIFFTPRSIMFSQEDGSRVLDEKNFDAFQEAMNFIFNIGKKDKEEIYNPANKRAEEIAQKIYKGRQKIAQLKAKEKGSAIGRFVSILSIGLHIPISEFKKYTLFQIYDSMERFGLYVGWDLDVRAKMAGATGTKPVDDWMKNLYEK